MPKVVLSRAFIEHATCGPGRAKVDYFDADQRGFMLEVRRSGGKTFYQRYTDERGRERQFKIGPADALSLDQARKKARIILAQALLGADPQARRRELREIPTLAELVRDRYLPHVKAYKRSWRTDETVFRVHILPLLGSKPIDEITGDAITDLIQRMRDKGYASGTTNRVLILIRFIFNLARKWKIAGVRENPTVGLNTAPDVQRDRFLTPEETKRLIASINIDENRSAAQTIMMLLLTGARRNEVSHAKWDYIDWERRTLLVPISKTGKPRAIALNGHAMALLAIDPARGRQPLYLSLAGHRQALPFAPLSVDADQAARHSRRPQAARPAAFLRELSRE